jgi:hypothetical protein
MAKYALIRSKDEMTGIKNANHDFSTNDTTGWAVGNDSAVTISVSDNKLTVMDATSGTASGLGFQSTSSNILPHNYMFELSYKITEVIGEITSVTVSQGSAGALTIPTTAGEHTIRGRYQAAAQGDVGELKFYINSAVANSGLTFEYISVKVINFLSTGTHLLPTEGIITGVEDDSMITTENTNEIGSATSSLLTNTGGSVLKMATPGFTETIEVFHEPDSSRKATNSIIKALAKASEAKGLFYDITDEISTNIRYIEIA